MIVRTFDGVQALTRPQPAYLTTEPSSVRLYDRQLAYAEIYRTQPNVRICVDFLARNFAQLTAHVYRRVSDTDRVRLADHQLARWMAKPNPATTSYRLKESLMGDLSVYMRAYWLKVRYTDADDADQIGLVRVPAEQMRPEGGLLPRAFVWSDGGRETVFPPSEIVYFDGYNPCSPLGGLSPLDTLSRILAEEEAAGQHRQNYWRNSSKQEGVIERALEAPSSKWSPKQKADYREQFQERYTESGAGSVAILEPGMTFKPASWSAKDSEYIAGGKLRREVCAAAYHIPQPLVGILDHATFSNIKEQHKHLYQDTLGPWLEMVQQEYERQLLIECDDQRDVYIEHNIAAKLAGTPEEQTDSLRNACGRAFMTVNEARARVNLPKDDDPESDRIAAQQGGPSDATAQPAADAGATAAPPNTADGPPSDDGDTARAVASVLEATRDRQTARLAKLPATDRPAAFAGDLDRWTRELSADLTPHLEAAAATRAQEETRATLRQLEADAVEARVRAVERQIAEPRPEPAPQPPQTINVQLSVTPEEREKQLTLLKNAAGEVTGATVRVST